jgi:hypothetical protein
VLLTGKQEDVKEVIIVFGRLFFESALRGEKGTGRGSGLVELRDEK